MEKTKNNNKITTIGGLARMIQGEFLGIKGEIGEMKGEIGEMKGEIGEMKGEIGEMKKEMGEVKYEMKELKQEVGEIKRDVKEMKENSSELFTKLDSFISLYKDQREELATLSHQVGRLENRIKKLEATRR